MKNNFEGNTVLVSKTISSSTYHGRPHIVVKFKLTHFTEHKLHFTYISTMITKTNKFRTNLIYNKSVIFSISIGRCGLKN